MVDDSRKNEDTTKLITPEQIAHLKAQAADSQASLIVLAGWEVGRRVDLAPATTVIGRSPFATVWVDKPSVSRQHAQIVREQTDDEERFVVSDMGSMNGTRVNNQAVESVRLKNDDKIQVGDVVFRFTLEDTVTSIFHEEVHRRIHYDELTGLLTLNSFLSHLEAEIRKGEEGRVFSLAMTDLDGLKKVNDTYGHLAGRMTIEYMGVVMREVVRSQDLAGLYGGDEAILLFAETPLAEAEEIAETLRASIHGHELEFQGKPFGVTISQGLAEWPRHGRTAQEIIAAADGALYAAKEAGRNCVRTAQ